MELAPLRKSAHGSAVKHLLKGGRYVTKHWEGARWWVGGGGVCDGENARAPGYVRACVRGCLRVRARERERAEGLEINLHGHISVTADQRRHQNDIALKINRNLRFTQTTKNPGI